MGKINFVIDSEYWIFFVVITEKEIKGTESEMCEN